MEASGNLKVRLNECSAPQYTRISDLRPEIPYKVLNFSKVHTSYGETICAVLEAIVGGNVFLRVYLPKRYLQVLSESTMENYNRGEEESISLVYRGLGKGVEFI